MGRESGLLPFLVAIAVIATYGIVLSSPTASAASRTWTTDTDFNSPGAQFTSTEVVGTGVPASVQLLKDTIDWRNMTPSTAPSAREGPGLAFAANGNLTFLFGGYDGTYLDDTW